MCSSDLRGCPMTPVEATIISSGEMPKAFAARALISSAISMPFALQVLALPLLQITAWAMPLDRCFFVTVRGAPLTRLVVYTAAALHGTLLKIKDKYEWDAFTYESAQRGSKLVGAQPIREGRA